MSLYNTNNTTVNLTHTNNNNKRLFLHLPYQPHDLSRQQIRNSFTDHLADTLHDELNINEQGFTMAYSRDKNIRDYVTSGRYKPEQGREPSVVINERGVEV